MSKVPDILAQDTRSYHYAVGYSWGYGNDHTSEMLVSYLQTATKDWLMGYADGKGDRENSQF